jgi:hypothetical protein
MIKKLLRTITGASQEERDAELYRNLIRHEARIGGTLFGEVPEGGRREFFCLDERTWIWHEEWVDKNGDRRVKTTRYDVRPDAILKAQDGQPYRPISPQEAHHLYQAAVLYGQRTRAELYNFV